METKRCSRCGMQKEREAFGACSSAKDGKQRNCIPCQREAVREGHAKSRKLLRAMRRALKTKNGEGGTAEVQTYRQLLRENPDRFMTRLEKMEADFRGQLAKRMEAAFQTQHGKGAGSAPPPAPEKMDEGTERVLALLAELRGAGL